MLSAGTSQRMALVALLRSGGSGAGAGGVLSLAAGVGGTKGGALKR